MIVCVTNFMWNLTSEQKGTTWKRKILVINISSGIFKHSLLLHVVNNCIKLLIIMGYFLKLGSSAFHALSLSFSLIWPKYLAPFSVPIFKIKSDGCSLRGVRKHVGVSHTITTPGVSLIILNCFLFQV